MDALTMGDPLLSLKQKSGRGHSAECVQLLYTLYTCRAAKDFDHLWPPGMLTVDKLAFFAGTHYVLHWRVSGSALESIPFRSQSRGFGCAKPHVPHWNPLPARLENPVRFTAT